MMLKEGDAQRRRQIKTSGMILQLLYKKKKAQKFPPPAAGETPHPANAAPSDTQHLQTPNTWACRGAPPAPWTPTLHLALSHACWHKEAQTPGHGMVSVPITQLLHEVALPEGRASALRVLTVL